MKAAAPKIALRICVYRTPDLKGMFVAHCLDLDVMAHAECVEKAVDELLKVIETQIELSHEYGAEIMHPAPKSVWRKYISSVMAGRRLPGEMVERIVSRANKRVGYFLDVVPSQEVPGMDVMSIA